MSALFSVGNQFELRVLYSALVGAKFPDGPPLGEFCRTPFVASLANRIVDALSREPPLGRGTPEATAQGWAESRRMGPTRREWWVVLQRVREILPGRT